MMNSYGAARPAAHYAQPKPYTHVRQESSHMRQETRHERGHGGGGSTWSNRVLHPPPPQRNHRATPTPQMRFSQPPPPSFTNFANSQPGFGGSSGPGCGGGDFWAELAHFGIYPSTSNSTLGTSSISRNTFASGNILVKNLVKSQCSKKWFDFFRPTFAFSGFRDFAHFFSWLRNFYATYSAFTFAFTSK